MNDSATSDKVRQLIAASMRVAVESVQPSTRLVDDLGAESIDFVDILTSVENAFHIEFCEQGTFAKLEELFGEGELSRGGKLTELGVRVMQERRPEIDPALFTVGLPVSDLNSMFTVDTWVRSVDEVLAARPSACPSCGHDTLTPGKGSKLVCAACKAWTRSPRQADVLESWHAQWVATSGAA